MDSSAHPFPPAAPLRRALGRLRRSPTIDGTATFLALQGRRARQRLGDRFVRGIWLHTSAYLRSRRRPTAAEFRVVLPAGRTVVGPPTFAAGSRSVAGSPLHARHGPRFVAELRQPWVVGPSGAVIADDRHLLWDLSYEWPGRPHLHTTYDREQLEPATELPGLTATLAAMAADTNYFHFLLNSVARLAYLRATPALAQPDRYLVSGPVTEFVADAFALFGIEQSRLVGALPGAVYRPAWLQAPSLVEPPFVVPAHVCAFLRESILPTLSRSSQPPRRRLFIDRTDASARRIVNLDELRPVLDAFGFEIVRLSGISLRAQAELFHSAELILANHGAALSNLVFCAPGTRVLQVLAPGMLEREYRTLSAHGQLRHDYVTADFATPTDRHLPLKQRDLILAPALLRRVLSSGKPR